MNEPSVVDDRDLHILTGLVTLLPLTYYSVSRRNRIGQCELSKVIRNGEQSSLFDFASPV